MTTPRIAIIGRPNVGKSTFFNRMLNKRHAIVDPQEGITRDRIYGVMEWCGQNIKFIDTGGFIYDDKNDFNKSVRTQSNDAMEEADFVIFMVVNKLIIIGTDANKAVIGIRINIIIFFINCPIPSLKLFKFSHISSVLFSGPKSSCISSSTFSDLSTVSSP